MTSICNTYENEKNIIVACSTTHHESTFMTHFDEISNLILSLLNNPIRVNIYFVFKIPSLFIEYSQQFLIEIENYNKQIYEQKNFHIIKDSNKSIFL